MPYADRNEERIDCLFNWNEKDRLLMLPGARYRRDPHGRDIVSLPLSWGSCLALRGMFGADLRLSETLGQWAAEHKRTVTGPGLALRSMTVPEMGTPGYGDMQDMITSGLKPFQAVGVGWMMTVGSGALGDEMGSGKTVQSLTFLERRTDTLPALVIVPNSVKGHWRKLSARWAPRAVPYVVDGTAAARRKILKAASTDPNALVIINLESVRSFSRLAPYGSIRLRRCQECDPKSGDAIKTSQCEIHEKELNGIGFRSVFLDEAHQIGNPESKQTRAVWHVMHSASVKYRWGLSGTIQSDHFGNLWSVLHGILPNDFPVKSKAVDRYCLVRANPIGAPEIIGLNPATRDELYGILDPHFRRMLKSVTSPQLPPVLRETRTAVLATKHQKIYNDMESSLFGDLGNGELIIAHSNLTKADRLQQIAAAAVEIEKPDEDDITTWKIRMKDPSPKVDVLMEILGDGGYLTGPGPGVAVAAVHKDLIRLVSDRLAAAEVRHGIITGDQSTAERDLALARFQDGHDRVLLFTVAAGSVGLDMTAADLLVNIQRPWSMVKAVQTEGRVHRIGSEIHQSVRIIDVVTEGTIEEEQVDRLTQKLMRLEEINRDTANVPQHEQDPDLQHEAELILNSDILSGPVPAPEQPEQPEQPEYVSPFLPVGHEGEHHETPFTPVTFDQAASVLQEAGVDSPAVLEALKEQLPAEVPIGEAEIPGALVQQPERMDCPCCEKNTKVNGDGTIRYHFSDKDECRIGPDSRRCRAVGQPWTTAFPPPGGESADVPLPDEQPVRGYVCRIPAGPAGCGRVVELTKNGRARSHLDPQDERCAGGSDHPIKVLEDGTRIDMKDEPEIEMCVRCNEPLPHVHEDTSDTVQVRTVVDVELRDLTPEEKEIAIDPDARAVTGTPEEQERGDQARAAMAKARESFRARQEADPEPAAVALAEDMRTPEQERTDQDELAVAMKAANDAQMEMLAQQNGTGHQYIDSTGIQWVHPGPETECRTPECRPAPVAFVVAGDSEPFLAFGPASDALKSEGTLPDQVVSATKINDWQQCKRKWWLRWYRNLEAPSDLTDVRNTGIRVHEALAAWYVPEGTERRDPRDVLREAIGRDWNRTLERMQITPQSEGFEAVAKKWESVAVLERAMIEGYMEWMEETAADAGYTVIGSELEVAVDMTDPVTMMTVQARGVVDAKIRRDVDGVRLFIDHKSVGDFERATRFLKMRNQMLHYHLIEWLSTPDGEARCDGALYNMLRRVKRTAKAKPPFFQRKTVEHTEIQLRAYRARLLGEARSMARAERMLEAGVPHHMAVPASPSDDCHWKCEFAAVCPMFDDGSRAEDMVQAVYRQGDPWQRYDLLGPGTTADRSI